ncbi:MAG: helix-turn-helix domain-containing protein [Cuniculiplasma sp.]
MKITSRITSDIACCSDLLESVFNFGKTDVIVFYTLTPRKWFRVEDISAIVGKDQSTVYRSLLKLAGMGFVIRDSQTIKDGGYYFTYALVNSTRMEKILKDKIEELSERMRTLTRDLIREMESRESL